VVGGDRPPLRPPGNRFWPALHAGGFTPRLLRPDEQGELLTYGLGITNLAARGTARADELTAAELREGGALLSAKLVAHRPAWLAVLGVTAYRSAFGQRHAVMGRQPEPLAGVPVWVLPNPSGLNAHYTAAALGHAFAELHAAVTQDPRNS